MLRKSALSLRQATALPALPAQSSVSIFVNAHADTALWGQQQLRRLSDNASPLPPPSPPSPPPGDFLYVGPFSAAVKKVKTLSLFSCACALGAGPIIMTVADGGMTLTAKASIAGTLATFGIFTTGLLHWFSSPYVHRLQYRSQDEMIEIDSLDLLGRPKSRRVALSEVAPADSVHPLSTFAVGNKVFYLDRDHFEDKALLRRLAPQPEADHAAAVEAAAVARGEETDSDDDGGSVVEGGKSASSSKKGSPAA